jgi:hypothetical protein
MIRKAHRGGWITKYRNMGWASIMRSAVAIMKRPAPICTHPNTFGVRVKVEPISPRRNPSSVYAASLHATNIPTCSHRFAGLPAGSGDANGLLIAVARSPPCTARHEIPPVVSPVINASHKIFIAIDNLGIQPYTDYIPYRGINVNPRICSGKRRLYAKRNTAG